MSRQNEDETSRPAQNKKQTSRRKFLTGAGFVGAAMVTPAAAKAVPQSEWSPEQISKLEEIVRDFVTNAEGRTYSPSVPLSHWRVTVATTQPGDAFPPPRHP